MGVVALRPQPRGDQCGSHNPQPAPPEVLLFAAHGAFRAKFKSGPARLIAAEEVLLSRVARPRRCAAARRKAKRREGKPSGCPRRLSRWLSPWPRRGPARPSAASLVCFTLHVFLPLIFPGTASPLLLSLSSSGVVLRALARYCHCWPLPLCRAEVAGSSTAFSLPASILV